MRACVYIGKFKCISNGKHSNWRQTRMQMERAREKEYEIGKLGIDIDECVHATPSNEKKIT